MATISATLRLFDRFSQTLAKARTSMNATTKTAQKLQQQLSVPVQMNVGAAVNTSSLGRVGRTIRVFLRRLPVIVQVALNVARLAVAAGRIKQLFGGNQPGPANSSAATGAVSEAIGANEKSEGFLEKAKSVGEAFGGMETIQKLGEATIGGAMEYQKLKDMFIAKTGDAEVGSAMFEKFKADALKTGTEVKEALEGSLSLLSVTKNTDQLTKLNDFAQRLHAFDSSGSGYEEAVSAVKEAFSGDTSSLAEKFSIPESEIEKLNLGELGKSGNMDGFLKAFDELLAKQGMGKEAFDKMLSTPTKQLDQLSGKFKSALADSGGMALQSLLPLITVLNQAFDEGKFKPFFTGLQVALYAIGNAASTVVGFIMNHLVALQNVLLAVGIIAAVVAAIWLGSWIIAVWPVFAVIAIVALLIAVLNDFGVSTQQIVGFVSGAFFALFAYLQNVIAVFWNWLVAFVEFFANMFNDPVYAIKKLIFDLVKGMVEFFINFIKSIDKGLNWLISKINSITGLKIDVDIESLDTKFLDQFKPTTNEDVRDLSKYRMPQKNVTEAFGQGLKFSDIAINAVKNGSGNMDFNSIFGNWNAKQPPANIGRVDTVGKIDDTVDVSSEDLDVMRDLAEIQSIQNFVTLTPTVQVSTGDIHQGADIDAMIKRIEEAMEATLANSAQGVYSY
ncbi:hypothetical protein [Paenibacillus hamazuiensis]|uniref:hypothetical protein n=1 Tax=Paenibacillus hamazuiensis TaxID=2936508 RepID=UPI00200FE242|nr:hypothetical protein [Paenibacillus hamazuiensis]